MFYIVDQDTSVSSSERVVLKNTKVFVVYVVGVGFPYVLCCRMDERWPKPVMVPRLMIVMVPKVSRYDVVLVIRLMSVVL